MVEPGPDFNPGATVSMEQAVIVRWEEPALRQRFGEDYSHYTREVRRWL